MTPYEILGVAPDASTSEIQAAYRRKAKEHHPDRDGGSTAAMSALNDAYRVLRNPSERVSYEECVRRRTAAQYVGEPSDGLGDRVTCAAMHACAVDPTKIRLPTLTLDGWVLPTHRGDY